MGISLSINGHRGGHRIEPRSYIYIFYSMGIFLLLITCINYISGLIALVIALATVGYRILRAVFANPVDALRQE